MPITLSYQGRIALVTLRNPEKLNALSSEDYFELASLLRQIADRPEILITILTGKGRFFSAGVDVKKQAQTTTATQEQSLPRLWQLRGLSHIIEATEAFYTHPKILVTALNGPVVGLTAALIAHSDFIYAMPHTYLLAPFISLGIPPEGAASVVFTTRLGFKRAAEALLMSKRISCEELLQCGFVNEVFDTGKDTERFLDRVFQELNIRVGPNIQPASAAQVKALMRQPQLQLMGAQTLAETLGVVTSISDRMTKTSEPERRKHRL